MTLNLFDDPIQVPRHEAIGPASWVLRGFALAAMADLLPALAEIEHCAPFRHLHTPGGQTMSVAMSNCGGLGWFSDHRGYRYVQQDPLTGLAWPAMPECFLILARTAAEQAGFAGFVPDACLINRYQPGSRLSLHQDRDERDLQAPIVSVSLGIAAMFLFGGLSRAEQAKRIALFDGDVVVWGGPDRLRYHGIAPLKPASHPVLGAQRINLTFRKAG